MATRRVSTRKRSGSILRNARGKRPRFVFGDKGKRGSRGKTVECFADEVRALPGGEAAQVNFGRLYHDRHVLGGPSALLP